MTMNQSSNDHSFARPHLRAAALGLCLAALAGCASIPEPVLPLSSTPWPAPELTLVWSGVGEAWRQSEAGAWEREESHDYEFLVLQRRYGDVWESTKEMHRRHPEYDGSAGPRDQSHHFSIRYQDEQDGQRPFELRTTLGDGDGRSDPTFERAQMTFEARGVSRFAPFNTYRITQRYLYDAGRLEERVELFKKENGREAPWAKIEEKAELFARHTFEGPPT